MTKQQLDAYRLALDLGETIWTEVRRWDAFARDTLGRRLVEAGDAVAVLLGGDAHDGDAPAPEAARACIAETSTWLVKAHRRGLLQDDAYRAMRGQVGALMRALRRRPDRRPSQIRMLKAV